MASSDIERLQAELKTAHEKADSNEKWFADQCRRIGVTGKFADDHEAEPFYLENTRAETAERNLAELLTVYVPENEPINKLIHSLIELSGTEDGLRVLRAKIYTEKLLNEACQALSLAVTEIKEHNRSQHDHVTKRDVLDKLEKVLERWRT